MNAATHGIHHVTAISADAQANHDFYTRILGLRFVKRTVNFDDPATYHFYFGDGIGSPGTILTFFPWQGAPRGRVGHGQTTAYAFAIPVGSLGYWRERLAAQRVPATDFVRFLERGISFVDPDGITVELIETKDAGVFAEWQAMPVPREHGIRRFHSVTVRTAAGEASAATFAALGYREIAKEGNRVRLGVPNHGAAQVDLDVVPATEPFGQMGAGTVHHVAFRAADADTQQGIRRALFANGHNVTPVRDRIYFQSIYLREPGGAILEVATDAPGFGVDEAPADLGSALRLPPWLEAERPFIEASLPAVDFGEPLAAGKDR